MVLADGAVPPRNRLDTAWPGWDDGVDLVVAADGGARHAATLGLRVDRWVGDGDSIDAALLGLLERSGVPIARAARDKDESDTELALLAAVEAGAGAIVLLGALGGVRVDHALANIGLLAHPALGGRPVVVYDEMGARISLLSAAGNARPVSRELAGRRGDVVSLLPLSAPAEGVTTRGLRYELRGETLPIGPARGLSNVRTAPVATVSLQSGLLLVIETPATLRP